MADDNGSLFISITSSPDSNGEYQLIIEFGDTGEIVPLDTDLARAWTDEVVSAICRAEYDVAVVRQMAEILGDTEREVGTAFIAEMRSQRGDFQHQPMFKGLRMIPGVAFDTGEPFIAIARDDEILGQWTVQDARAHALGLLEALEIARLDSAYFAMMQRMDVDTDMAAIAINDLGRFRDPVA